MKRIVLVASMVLACFLPAVSWAEKVDTVNQTDQVELGIRDGVIGNIQTHIVTTNVVDEKGFTPVVSVPANIPANLALEAVRNSAARYNIERTSHNNPFWFLLEKPRIRYDEVTYQHGEFSTNIGREEIAAVATGPSWFWIAILASFLLSLFFPKKDGVFVLFMGLVYFLCFPLVGLFLVTETLGINITMLDKQGILSLWPFVVVIYTPAIPGLLISKWYATTQARKKNKKKMTLAAV